MKFLLLYVLVSVGLYAVDYKNMFLSEERYNAYSSLTDNPEQETQAYYTALESKGGKYAKKSEFKYQAQIALEKQAGYDNNGYAVILSAIKSFPKFFPKYPGIFTQADFLYTYNDLSSGSDAKSEIAISAYGGYEYMIDKRISIFGRAGTSFLTGSGSFALTYGLGAKYDLQIYGIVLVANVVRLDSFYAYSGGAQLDF